ncbi:MAG: hypothetical protein QXP98_03345 [Thermoproteus sp.]
MRELVKFVLAVTIAVLALALAGAHTTLAANTTSVNGTNSTQTANITSVNATKAPAANVTQLPNATEVYVTTPSGTIHIVYVSNTTQIVVNYNKQVLTVNLKTVIYNGSTAYYIHVVGHALGNYNSTYVSQLLSQVASALKSGNTTQALALLKELGSYVATSNATKRAEVNIMLTAKALNSTTPNATYLKARVEYEVERGIKAINGTSSEVEVKAFASNMSQLSAFLSALASRLAPYNPSAAAQLKEAASLISNITVPIKELEVKLANGTQIEIHKVGKGYKVEVQAGSGEEHGNKAKGSEEHKGASGEDHGNKAKTTSTEEHKGAGKVKPTGGDEDSRDGGSSSGTTPVGGTQNSGEQDEGNGED